jgi:hypothetical protein
MRKFTDNITRLILIGVFLGLGAAVVHPYLHAYQTHAHQVKDSDKSAFYRVDSFPSDTCYVCTFSKDFIFDNAALETAFVTNVKKTFSWPSQDKLVLEYGPIYYLRAPPAT